MKKQYWWFLLKGEHIIKTGPTVRLLTEVTRDYDIDLEALAPTVPGLGASGEIEWVELKPWEKPLYVSKTVSVETTDTMVKVEKLYLKM